MVPPSSQTCAGITFRRTKKHQVNFVLIFCVDDDSAKKCKQTTVIYGKLT